MEKRHPSNEETEPEGVKRPEKRREKSFSLLRLQRTDSSPEEPEHLVYRRSSETTQETTAERKPRAAGVFLGAEYLSRRRDRKIHRQTERLQKRVAEGERARQELEQIASKSAEQLLIVKSQQEAFERRPLPNQEQSVEVKQHLKPLEKPNDSAALEFKPAIDVEHTPEVPPSVVLKEVEKAAEFNKPIEDLFEHRAEVKDKSTTPGATPIGNVISSLRNDSSPTSPNLGAVSPVLPQSEDPKTPAPLPRGIYRQAINAGFWIALTLIVLGIIAYFAF